MEPSTFVIHHILQLDSWIPLAESLIQACITTELYNGDLNTGLSNSTGQAFCHYVQLYSAPYKLPISTFHILKNVIWNLGATEYFSSHH